ncbi:discoidin domain-containing protein [Paenibacillus flagellatus]|nr:discoidin domain-containing protein [Paenibacillus flagellatus]
MKKRWLSMLLLVVWGLSLPLTASTPAYATAPAPVINHGPYLINMTETAVTIMWFTDLASTSKVEYGTGGSYANSKYEEEKGLKTVSKRHSVRLTGLTPGTTYNYRVVSTEVENLLPNNPVIGETVTSPGYTFTTFDTSKPEITFYQITDTHTDAARMNELLSRVNLSQADFVAFTGDILGDVSSESQVFSTFIDPVVNHFAKTVPIVFVRGNHELRGSYSRYLFDYVPTETGEWYYGFKHGPASFIVTDGCEDKADEHPEYSGLNACQSYQNTEFPWVQHYVNSADFQRSPVKISLMHQPNFDYYVRNQYKTVMSDAGVQLALAGHTHLRSIYPPDQSVDYNLVILGQNEVNKVHVNASEIKISTLNRSGAIVDGMTVPIPAANTDYSGINLAKWKSVTASSSVDNWGWSLQGAADNNRASTSSSMGWSSSNSPTSNHTEWVTVDLGVIRDISRVDLYARNDAGNVGKFFPIDFTIQVSTDLVNWTTVVAKTSQAKPDGSAQGYGFTTVPARYVKIEGTALRPDAGEYRMQFAEIEVLGGNLAAHKSAAASSSYENGYTGWGVNGVVDGVRSSETYVSSLGWSSSGSTSVNHTEWVQVDLGAASTVSRVDLFPRNDAGSVGEYFPVDFTIKVSRDNTNWTTVVTKTGYAKPGNQAQSFSFPAQTDIRYVKVEATSLRSFGGEYRMQLAEIGVY